MNVAELIEWLKTQDQDATVFVLVGQQGRGWDGDSYRLEELTPDYTEYIDRRGNQFVKPSDRHYNMRVADSWRDGMTQHQTPAEMAEECQRLVRRVSDASYTQGIDERHDSPSRDQRNDDKVRALLAESRAAIDRLRAMAESAQQVAGKPDARRVVPEHRVADVGFRWDGEALQHVPQVLIEFEPVPANAGSGAKGWQDRDSMVAMLAAAPEAPEAPRGEPVAWQCKDFADGWILFNTQLEAAKYQKSTGCLMQPLYTTPQPKRVPLTDEQIEAAGREAIAVWVTIQSGSDLDKFARAIERAHGITGETE